MNEKIEEDSILTQLTKDDEEEKEMEENELDFSLWLETATTPTKIIQKNDDEEISDDDLLNVTLIPQMDGCCDEIGEVKINFLNPNITIVIAKKSKIFFNTFQY